MLETLKTILAILSRYRYEDEAAFVARLVSLHDTDRQAFVSEIQSNDMWGGAMSVADVTPVCARFSFLRQRPGAPEHRRYA
jgi:hypothetical protein